MSDQTELLPCPFCSSSVMPGVSWAQCSNSACPAFHIRTHDLRMWNTRAAPAEDVRAVVEEPVAWAQNTDLRAIAEGALWAGTLWGRQNPSILPNRSPLYRHPQRPVVLPKFNEWYAKNIGVLGTASAKHDEAVWRACLDAVEDLNK